jgi:protein-disulfide isomerase
MDRRTMMVGAGALVMAVGASIFAIGGNSDLPDPGAANAQEAADVDTSSIVEMAMGPEDAPVTVIEYASFTCPHCATFHNGPAQKLKSEYVDTGKVRFVYRDVYFDRPGLWASMVARCDPDRFFGITDMLYKQQRDWIGEGQPAQIADNLRRIGKVAGLDDDQLETCMTDAEKAQTLVAWFQQNAEADEVDSTPSLVINGEKHPNMAWADLKSIIDGELAE